MRKVLEQINKERLVAIIRLENESAIEQVAASLYEGGIRVIEVTMNTPGALKAIRKMSDMYEDMIVGAGTVLDPETAGEAIRHGARFLLAPTLNPETIKLGNRYGTPVIPGVMTPTEALAAYEQGAQIVKVFPVRSLGVGYAKDLHGPLPFLNVMAVGGVSIENVEEYLDSGWNSVGLGSALVDLKLIKEEKFPEIKKRAEQFVEIRDRSNAKSSE